MFHVWQEDGVGTKLSDQVSDKNHLETDSSTPALYNSDKDKLRSKKMKMKMEKKKRRRREELEIAESIRWLAEVVVRSEQTRMDTMREIERMRVEAEAKRGEMDLKRTEILANTQLEIARLFAGIGKGVDSSLRIGRSWDDNWKLIIICIGLCINTEKGKGNFWRRKSWGRFN